MLGLWFSLKSSWEFSTLSKQWEEEDGFNGLCDGWKAYEYSFVDNKTVKYNIQIDKEGYLKCLGY